MLSISVLAITSVTSTSSELVCPEGYAELSGICARHVETPVQTWYGAEGVCRAEGTHLLSLSDGVESFPLPPMEAQAKMWTGARKTTASPWTWSDLSPFKATLTPLPMTTTAPQCAYLHDNILHAVDCTERNGFTCVAGAPGCNWPGIPLAIAGNLAGNADHHKIYIINSALSLDSPTNQIALGNWITPNTYEVHGLFEGCPLFKAVFTINGGVYKVSTGCDGGALVEAAFSEQPECSRISGNGVSPDGTEAMGTTDPNASNNAHNSQGKQPDVRAVQGDGGDDAVPIWVWPLAFAAVAAVSAMATFGVVKRRKTSKTSLSTDEEDSPASSEHMEMEASVTECCTRPTGKARFSKDPSSCETCKKFNAGMAKRRLKAVHEQLAREFALPVVVRGTHCEHNENDHVHVFEVENDFDASTMGALSTVYSRTKPRLPKNTRVHIVRAKAEDGTPAGGETDFSGMWDGQVYF